jgi:hypothetical protein
MAGTHISVCDISWNPFHFVKSAFSKMMPELGAFKIHQLGAVNDQTLSTAFS